MVRNITLRVLAYLLLLIILVVATCYFLSEGEYILGVAASIFVVGCCFRIVWNVRSVNRKLAYFFQALENDDYSIHFPEHGGSHSERFLNGVLNRVKDILQNTRLEIQQREKFYELIINSVSSGIVALDEWGFVTQNNQIALKLLDFRDIYTR